MPAKTKKDYDVVIVGSGAGGGIAAHILANAGAKICMLEAGAWYDCTKNGSGANFKLAQLTSTVCRFGIRRPPQRSRLRARSSAGPATCRP